MLIGLHSRHATAAAAACAFLCLASHAAAGDRHGTARASCPPPRVTAGELGVLRDALAAGRDVLGRRLLDSREGPSYAAVRRLLPPLWYARGRGGLPLTRTGAYYLTFAHPLSLYGEKAFALHVADGSAILTRRVDGPSLTILVGDGREIYGSCLARLGRPRRAHGWLPVLRTSYVDARGVRYAQESFAGRVPGVRSLVSFVRLAVDTRRAGSATAVVRFAASPGSRARLVTDRQGVLDQGGARYGVRGARVLYVAWVHSPGRGSLDVGAAAYDLALRATERFWEGELARGATFDVPERSVLDAERSLLVQQRILTWRYSVGNPYEELSFAEALDAARVMAGYGHTDVSKAILRFALRGCRPGSRAGARGPCCSRLRSTTGSPGTRRSSTRKRQRSRSPASRVRWSAGAALACSTGKPSRRMYAAASSGSTGRRSPGRGCWRWDVSGSVSGTIAWRRERRSRVCASSRPSGRLCGPRNDVSRTNRYSSRRLSSTARGRSTG